MEAPQERRGPPPIDTSVPPAANSALSAPSVFAANSAQGNPAIDDLERNASAPPGLTRQQSRLQQLTSPISTPQARQARVNIAASLAPQNSISGLFNRPTQPVQEEAQQLQSQQLFGQRSPQQQQGGNSFFFNFAILIPVLWVTWDEPCDKPVRVYLLLLLGHNAVNAVMYILTQRVAPPDAAGQRSPFMRRVAVLWGALSTLAFMVLFVLGNLWTWNTTECDRTLRGTAIFFLVIVYISLSLLVVVACLVCCFLPTILRARAMAPQGAAGATADQLEALDKHAFDAEELVADDAVCCLCLDAYQPGVEIRTLGCRHHYHVKCIDQWLKIKAICPLCRHSVIPNGSNGEEGSPDSAEGAHPRGDDAV